MYERSLQPKPLPAEPAEDSRDEREPTHGLRGKWSQVANLTGVGAVIVMFFVFGTMAFRHITAMHHDMIEIIGGAVDRNTNAIDRLADELRTRRTNE